MRVLFWSELFWPYIGGIEILATKLLPALRKRGYEFSVVTSHDYLELPDEADHEGIPVYRFPFRTALATRNVSQLVEARQGVAKLKRTFAPDLVHLYALGPGALFHFHTIEAHRAPLLVTMHGEVLRVQAADHDTLLEKTLRSATWVACVSKAVLLAARRLVPEIERCSSVIYNGVEGSTVVPELLPHNAMRLLCLGRLVADKGFDLALTAFATVVKRFPQARLVIAGDGPMRPVLEEQASQLGLRGVVEFVGWVASHKIADLMKTASLVVMPSRREGLPLVAIQAAQLALPIVAARVGGLPEAVVHGQTGLVIEPEDSTALADAITFLLEHSEEATQMGKAAQERARELFSWERHVDASDALYQKLLKQV